MRLHSRWLSAIPRLIVSLWLASLAPITSIAHSTESTQIVVTGGSAVQLVDTYHGLIKDIFASRSGDLSPVCLPTGAGIAFVRGVGPGRELFVYDLRQKQPVQITFEMDVRIRFSVSPDGEHLAYVSNRTKQVYVVRIDNRQSMQLTTNFVGVDWGGPQAPVWSPDGKRLAVGYFERDSYQTSFHVIDITTRRVTPIPTPPANAPLNWSPWSPDSTKLALGGMGRTIIVDVSNDQPRTIREVTGYVRNVNWSPDGTKLAFEQGKEGRYCDDVYVLDLRSGGTKRVNPWFLEYRCFHGPTWSPDSKSLAFLGYFSRGDLSLFGPDTISDQLYLADGSGTARRLTEDLKERNIYGVSWCPRPLTFER